MTTEERIAQLEAQIDKLQAKQAELHRQFARAQIDQWQGRIEDLELQLHAVAAEANDKLTAVMDQLRSKWPMPGGSSRMLPRRRPAWRTRYGPVLRMPSAKSARPCSNPGAS